MSEDLAAWLLEQIAEDERLARAVIEAWPGEWQRMWMFGDDGLPWSTIQLVEQFDPGRVLAECAAKRAIAERHRRCGTGAGYCDDGPHGNNDGTPCPDLFDLAQPYAGRRGWRDEWTT